MVDGVDIVPDSVASMTTLQGSSRLTDGSSSRAPTRSTR